MQPKRQDSDGSSAVGAATSSNSRLDHQTPTSPSVRDHSVRFYDGDESLFRTVATFLNEGLREGASVVVIATAPHRVGFRRQLLADGVDIGRHIASRRFVSLDAGEMLETIMVDDLPDPAAFARSVGTVLRQSHASAVRPNAPMYVYGEMVDVLCAQGRADDAVRLEALWNELTGVHAVKLLCGYRLDRFSRVSDSETFEHVCRAHQHVLPSERVPESANGEGMREIARLEQRAQALENEIARRVELERALRRALSDREQAESRLRSREREVLDAERKLHDADRRRDEFLAMLAHELRNPLAPIVTTSQLMRVLAGDRQDLSRHLDLLERQTCHMSKLIDDLLEVSRITRGKIRLERQPLDAAIAIARAVELSRPAIEGRRHGIAVRLPDEPLWIDADPTRMVQVLGNLLHNAAKYTDEGGSIEIGAHREGEQVVFRVSDNGIGIDPELQPQLFELFTQGDTSLDRSQGGLGIGLTLVRGLVELHGGSVAVSSSGRGRGSTFTVRLPYRTPGAQSLRPATPPALDQIPACRIVVVDDHLDAAVSLAELLRMSGQHVAIAHDGASALDLVRTEQPDIVLLDIGLPRMDGYEVARQLRREHGSRPTLVALTGYGQQEDRRRSRDAGFDHHLVKPIDLTALRDILSAGAAH